VTEKEELEILGELLENWILSRGYVKGNGGVTVGENPYTYVRRDFFIPPNNNEKIPFIWFCIFGKRYYQGEHRVIVKVYSNARIELWPPGDRPALVMTAADPKWTDVANPMVHPITEEDRLAWRRDWRR
jgi:hypothetical protein